MLFRYIQARASLAASHCMVICLQHSRPGLRMCLRQRIWSVRDVRDTPLATHATLQFVRGKCHTQTANA